MSTVKLTFADLKTLVANAQSIGNEARCLPLLLEWAEAANTEIGKLKTAADSMRAKLQEIVVTDGCDKGVVLLSHDGPTHYDHEIQCQVYDHENFSPLGDALIELYEMIPVWQTS